MILVVCVVFHQSQSMTEVVRRVPSERSQDDAGGLVCEVSDRFRGRTIKNPRSQFTFSNMAEIINQSRAKDERDEVHPARNPSDSIVKHWPRTEEGII